MFKYTLEECQYKLLRNGRAIPFVAQLNTQRGFNRRKHELFDTMNTPFQEKQFNFTKIKSKEVLFFLRPDEKTTVATYSKKFCARNDHAVVVNVSPIDHCHILLIPELNKCRNQKMTVAALLLAFDLVQLSGHPGKDFKIMITLKHSRCFIIVPNQGIKIQVLLSIRLVLQSLM